MIAEVHILVGPARCGKTHQLLSEYRHHWATISQSKLRLPRLGWLVPNRESADQLQSALLQTTKTAILQPNLYTFANFADQIISRSPRLIRSISNAQKRRLLQTTIRAAAADKQLVHFRQVAETPGFLTQVDRFIAEQKRSDIWPDELARLCQRRPKSDRRSRELSLLYSAYQHKLHQADLYDAEGRFWAAREILAAEPPSEHPFDLLIVSGFNDFTSAQYDILRLLAQRAQRLRFALTMDPAGPAGELLFAKPRQTLTRLRESFPQAVIQELAPSIAEMNSLRDFQCQALREPQSEAAAGGVFQGVEILAASSEADEADQLVGRIKALLLTGNTRPDDIVVVPRGGEAQASLLASAFRDYGIRAYWQQRPRLETQPLVRSLLALIHLAVEDWPYTTLLEVLGNRLFTRLEAAPDSPFLLQPRLACEVCIRAAQFPAGCEALLQHLENRSKSQVSEPTKEIARRHEQNRVALATLRALEAVLTSLPQRATLREWATALEQLLAQMGTFPAQSSETGRLRTAWQTLRSNLLSLERVDGWISSALPEFSLGELRVLIEALAAEVPAPVEQDAAGRVRVLAAESARKLTMQHLLIAGLGEQAFASGAEQQPETEATHAAQLDSEESSNAAPQSESLLLLYELVTRPTQSLTLSYASLDSKGQPLPPSPLLTELEHSVGAQRLRRSVSSLGQQSGLPTPSSLGHFRRRAIEQALDDKPRWLAGMLSRSEYLRTGCSILASIECVAHRGIREEFGPYEGLLLNPEAQTTLARRFGPEHLWSPSQLEGYASCPYRFFAEQLLKLEPLEELALSNDPRRRGSLLHQVLATIHAELSAALTDPKAVDLSQADPAASELTGVDLVQRFLIALDEAVKAMPLYGLEQSLREIERREIASWAPSYAEQEQKYRQQWRDFDLPPRPAHFEVRFGPKARRNSDEPDDPASTPLPFELNLGKEKIRLTGQIDRIDIGQVGGVTVFNIIDYKTGQGVTLKHEKVRSGRQLQLPLYAMAAEQLLLAEQGAIGLATGYWNIKGGGFGTSRSGKLEMRTLTKDQLQTSDDWEDLQPEILEKVQELITGIRGGQFPVFNDDPYCTRSCELSTICRISQVRSLEKVWPPAPKPEESEDGQ